MNVMHINFFYIEGWLYGFSIQELEYQNQNRDIQMLFALVALIMHANLTNPTISLFCNVLKECPQSTLLLKSISFHEQDEQDRIREKFRKTGNRTRSPDHHGLGSRWA